METKHIKCDCVPMLTIANESRVQVFKPTSRELNHADAVVREIRAMGVDEIRSEIAKRRVFRNLQHGSSLAL